MKRLSPARRKLIRTAVLCAVSLLVMAALALLFWLVPPERLLPAAAVPERNEGELRLHFLDVGQGDCTIVEFPEGDILVVDAGDGTFAVRNRIAQYIRGLSPASVTMLLTHADIDHYGGFGRLIEVFGTEKFYLPMIGSAVGEYQSLLKKIGEAGCETEVLSRYGVIERPSGAYLVCLSPYSLDETDENEASAVLYLEYCGVHAVLCGDIPASRERKLAGEYALDGTLFDRGAYTVRLEGTQILKVSHHGSDAASSSEWLELLRPQTAVISCGRGNGYRHPASGALARLKAASPDVGIFRTDERGNIMVTITREGTYSVSADTE